MANNTTLNAATVGGGQTIATEDISGVQFQRVKLALGGFGQDLGDVSGTNPLVVDMGGSSVGAFGDLVTSENTPLVQFDFVYGINSQQGTTSVVSTGVADTSAQRLRLQTGTGVAGSAVFESKRAVKYRAGQGVTARFTFAFATGTASSQQGVGVGYSQNGYFFGYNGTQFGVLHRNGGVDTWVAQSAWNGDKCNGTGASGLTVAPQFGNVYMVRYPYLGYGVVTFWILSPTTGRWILAHTIQYPNSTVAVQLTNPSLALYAFMTNTGNNTNLIGYSGSMSALLTGARSFIGNPRYAFDNNKSTITAETNLFSVKNATTYNGAPNRGQLRLNSLAFGTNATNAATVVRLRIGATLGGAATYTAVNGTTADEGVTITSGNSIASVNTAHTTSTGGTMYFALSNNGQATAVIDLTSYELVVAPGEILTVAGFSTASATMSASLTWSEDI